MVVTIEMLDGALREALGRARTRRELRTLALAPPRTSGVDVLRAVAVGPVRKDDIVVVRDVASRQLQVERAALVGCGASAPAPGGSLFVAGGDAEDGDDVVINTYQTVTLPLDADIGAPVYLGADGRATTTAADPVVQVGITLGEAKEGGVRALLRPGALPDALPSRSPLQDEEPKRVRRKIITRRAAD